MSTTATAPSLLVFVPLEPPARLASKTLAMNALTTLAKMDNVLTASEITIALVNQNGKARTAMSTIRQVLEESTSQMAVSSS